MSRIHRASPGVHPGEMFEDDPQLAAFARDLRSAVGSTPAPVVSPALAAVLEGREPAPTPGSLPRSAPRRRRAAARWAIGGAVFGLGIGSLGVAGALPAPVQRQVAKLGDVVGVDLPEPAQDTPATSVVPTVVPPSTVPPARTSHPTTSVPAADDRGSSEDHRPSTTIENTGQGDDHRSERGDDHANDDGTPPVTTAGNGGDGGASPAKNGRGDDEGDDEDPSSGPSTPHTSLDTRGSSRSQDVVDDVLGDD